MVTFSQLLYLSLMLIKKGGSHRGNVKGPSELPLAGGHPSNKMRPCLVIYLVSQQVADPVVTFCETVVETSSLKCFAETPNKK